jgi:hypothetical protein
VGFSDEKVRVVLYQRVKGALFAVMSERHALNIVGCRLFACGHLHHLVLGDEQEFGLWVNEFADKRCVPVRRSYAPRHEANLQLARKAMDDMYAKRVKSDKLSALDAAAKVLQ